jgi:hypothetical protein
MNLTNAKHHLNKIHTHRKWVRHYGKMMGLSKWQAWTHDLSKYSPTEFFESVKYYQGDRSPIDACKEANGVSYAWMHHKGRNPHHYEYWQDNFDRGGTPVMMPYKYAIEMLCDYLAAGRAYMGDKFTYKSELEWWYKKRQNCAMHLHTKWFISIALEDLWMQEREGCSQIILGKLNLNAMWDAATAKWDERIPIENDV